MKFKHSPNGLKIEGMRILTLLRQGKSLTKSDLETLSKIIDESESVALGVSAIYGILLVAVLAVIFVKDFIAGETQVELNAAIILPV